MPEQPTADTHDLSFILDRLAQEKGVVHALLYTGDGLFRSAADGLERDLADRTSAAAAGLSSLGRTIGEFIGAEGKAPRKVILDWPEENGCILIFGAGHNTSLVVAVGAELASPEVTVATAATLKTIKSLRPVLSARARTGSGDA